MNHIFRATGENYGEAMKSLDGELAKTKATEEERLTAQLLFEECFTRMEGAFASAEEFTAELCVRQRWGGVSFRLSSKGEAFNPLETVKRLRDDEPATQGKTGTTSFSSRCAPPEANRRAWYSRPLRWASFADCR